jgi:hypothetical protein
MIGLNVFGIRRKKEREEMKTRRRAREHIQSYHPQTASIYWKFPLRLSESGAMELGLGYRYFCG